MNRKQWYTASQRTIGIAYFAVIGVAILICVYLNDHPPM